MKRCTKGKSCGATCITRDDRCVLELGPVISQSLTKARSKVGVVQLYYRVRDQKIKGGQAKFERIRKDLAGEVGGRINRTADLIELKNRLQKEGLIPKSKKSEDALAAIFMRGIEAGKKTKRPEFTPLPTDLKNQLAALPPPPQAPRQLSQSPGGARMRPPASTQGMLDDISRILRGESPQNISIASGPGEAGIRARAKGEKAGSATGNTKWARLDANDFDGAFKIFKRIRGDADMIDWNETVKQGKKIGEGSFGTVLRLGDVAHKRGEVGANEADIIRRVGQAGIGPRLLVGEIGTKKHNVYGTDIHDGRIAMSIVPGRPIGSAAKPDKKIGGKNVADIYWKAMADLHRLGIAHNDAHIDNILVDKSGKGRWVDMGLAQANPKAALAEAMGIFRTIPGHEASRAPGAAGQGNWQARRWNGTGISAAEAAKSKGMESWKEFMERFPTAAKVWENRAAAQFKLRKMGLDQSDLSSIIDHGIRSPLDSYTKGVWAKISDKQAQEVLNTLYEGI